jgi:hypothetical protein
LSSSSAEFNPTKNENIISHDDPLKAKYNNNDNNTILDLERKISLAKDQERVDL